MARPGERDHGPVVVKAQRQVGLQSDGVGDRTTQRPPGPAQHLESDENAQVPIAVTQKHSRARVEWLLALVDDVGIIRTAQPQPARRFTDEPTVAGVRTHRLRRDTELLHEPLDEFLEVHATPGAVDGLLDLLKDPGVLLAAPDPQAVALLASSHDPRVRLHGVQQRTRIGVIPDRFV